MRINQIRSYHIELTSTEMLEYHNLGPRKDRVLCDTLDVWVDAHGAAKIRFRGTYLDPLDLDDRNRPKTKRFDVVGTPAQLSTTEPITEFLGKLNLMRQDEMSLEHFLAAEDPVG